MMINTFKRNKIKLNMKKPENCIIYISVSREAVYVSEQGNEVSKNSSTRKTILIIIAVLLVVGGATGRFLVSRIFLE